MTNAIRKIRRRRKLRRDTEGDVAALSPEAAAQLLRQFERNEVGDEPVRLLLAQRGQLLRNPGEAKAMRGYELAIRGGRRVRYSTFSILTFETPETDEHLKTRATAIADQLIADVESAFEENDDDSDS